MMNLNLSLFMVEVNLTKDETRLPGTLTNATVTNVTTYNHKTTIGSFEMNETGNYTCTAAVRSRSCFLIDSDMKSSLLTVTTGSHNII